MNCRQAVALEQRTKGKCHGDATQVSRRYDNPASKTYQLAAQLDEKSSRITLLVARLTMMPMSRRHVDSISENELMKTEQKRPVYCEPARNSTGKRKFALHLCLYLSHASFLSFLCVCPFLSLSLSSFPFSFLSVSYFLLYLLHSSFLSLLFLVCFFSYFLCL